MCVTRQRHWRARHEAENGRAAGDRYRCKQRTSHYLEQKSREHHTLTQT
jgi:hypothetical protein